MVYLVHVKVAYNDFLFQFDRLEAAVLFVKTIKQNCVVQLSNDKIYKEIIEVLTEDEFKERIEERKGE